MNYIKEFTKYDNLVRDDIYHKKIGAKNILFIGGCRSYIYSILFEEICKHVLYFINGQFGYATIGVHIIDTLKRQKTNNLKYIIENADYIVWEQTRNYSFLNSSTKCEQNIFNNFNIKSNCKIIQIPNLELRYYSNDLIYQNKEDINNIEIVRAIKKENLRKFIEHCQNYEFYNLSTYIENNINTQRLFNTINHPCNNILLELFKELFEYIELLDHNLSSSNNMQKYILERTNKK